MGRSELVYLDYLSGPKASIYSITTGDGRTVISDIFIREHTREYEQDLISIFGRLKSIGNTVGGMAAYFKLNEGLEWDDQICALYDIPDKHLRLYCIRLSEQIIIIGNGGPKNVRAWQQDSRLGKAVREMMFYAKIIRVKLEKGNLYMSESGLRLYGDLILTR